MRTDVLIDALWQTVDEDAPLEVYAVLDAARDEAGFLAAIAGTRWFRRPARGFSTGASTEPCPRLTVTCLPRSAGTACKFPCRSGAGSNGEAEMC